MSPKGVRPRTRSVEVVQATHHLFTQPEGRTATDRCLAIMRGRVTPSGPQGRPPWRIAPGKRQAREEESRGGKKTHSRSEPGRGEKSEVRPLLPRQEGQSLLAVSRKRAFKRKMYARFREKKGRASKMYQQGTETVSLY